MQQFTVPQFIDVEDKIIGPLTTRQFLIMMVAFMIIGINYKLLSFTWFLFSGVFIFGFAGILAFFKVNGMPFHFFILNFVQTSKRPAKRIWSNFYGRIDVDLDGADIKKEPDNLPPPAKPLNSSRLAELSLVVDTQGAFRGGRQARQEEIRRLNDIQI